MPADTAAVRTGLAAVWGAGSLTGRATVVAEAASIVAGAGEAVAGLRGLGLAWLRRGCRDRLAPGGGRHDRLRDIRGGARRGRGGQWDSGRVVVRVRCQRRAWLVRGEARRGPGWRGDWCE